MIRIILGTKAQLIKMAPVIRELAARKLPYDLIMTGQHHETMQDLLDVFRIRPPDVEIVTNFEASTQQRMVSWLCRLGWRAGVSMRTTLWRPRPDITLVHGDTVSTLVGALMSRLAGVRVAHVEAGLRSFNLFHPFPEEITRRVVSRLASVFYCPGNWAAANLETPGRDVVNTGANTLLDALRMALAATPRTAPPRGTYAVVSIHRFENLSTRSRFSFLMETVTRTSVAIPVLFVMHPATRERLRSSGWFDPLSGTPEVTLLERQDYVSFVHLLREARFLMTDGGSNQEEASFLGLPCLLLRLATERNEGLGRNVVISNYDRGIIERFVEEHSRRTWVDRQLPEIFPSRVIVDHLERIAGASSSSRDGT